MEMRGYSCLLYESVSSILFSVLVFVLVISIWQTSVCLGQGEESAKELEPIVVTDEPIEKSYIVEDASTATKTETPVQDTPQSVQVLDRELLNDQAAIRLIDVFYNIPGAVPAEHTTIPYLLRGFMAEILRDGFKPSSFIAGNISEAVLTNVQRLEVVQGPESILYGNISAGGVINLITKQPLPDLYIAPDIFHGSYDLFRTSLDITGPLLEDRSLLGRLNGSYLNSNSFRDFIKDERVFVSPVLAWYLTPKVKLSFDGEYLYASRMVDEGLVAVGDKVANIPISRNLAEPTDESNLEKYSARITLESQITDNIKLRNSFRYYKVQIHMDDHLSAFLLPDNRTLLRNIIQYELDDDIYTSQNDLIVNFDIGSVPNKALFGVEFIRENFDSFNDTLESNPIDILDPVYGEGPPDPPLLLSINRFGKINNLGIYVQDQITLFDRLYILAGVRYDLIDQDVDNEDSRFPEGFNAKKTDSKFSPRLGVLYRVTPEVSAYGSFVQGFNLTARTGVSVDGKIFDPQRSTQLEAGLKFNLLDNRIFSTVSYFWLINKNFIVADPLNPFFFGIQVDKARSRGVEVNVTAQITPEWNLLANYAYIDTKVLKDDFFQEGNELPGVPKNSASLWTTYFFSKGILEGAGLGFGAITQSNRQGDLENTFTLGSFIRLDAAIYYNRSIEQIGNFEASVHFRNITDERYFVNSESRVFIVPGAPFNVLASLRYYYH